MNPTHAMTHWRRGWHNLLVNRVAASSLISKHHRGNLLARLGMNTHGARVMRGVRFGSRMVTLEPGSFVNEDVVFDGNAHIHISAGAAIGPGVKFITSGHQIGPSEHRVGPLDAQPITVGKGAWVGAYTVVLPGVTIGDGAIIAAGAVVTRNAEPNTMHAGVPARPVRELV